jgi:hypothetical protein
LLNCALLLAVPPDMFWCLLTCCVLAIIGRHEVCDFSLVLWADFVWSFLGHYRPWWHVFDFFWNYFSETIQKQLSETNSNFLKLILSETIFLKLSETFWK